MKSQIRSNIRNKNLFLTFVKINAMLSDFENFVSENKLFSKKDKLLLAISGGIDSMCLFHLLLLGRYNFSVAHCNFMLRGEDSMLDEAFIKKQADRNGIHTHFIRFDTVAESEKLKTGTQETARILRYAWFEELRRDAGYTRILTAHHLSDNTETMLINLLRSGGISGLHGIPLRNGVIARPLMFADRDAVQAFMTQNQFTYRHDISNDSDDYLRNRIRHHVIPELKKIDPASDQHFYASAARVSEFESVSQNLLDIFVSTHTETQNGILMLNDKVFDKILYPAAFLYQFLKKYGFSRQACEGFNDFKNLQAGAKIESDLWVLCRERNGFSLHEKQKDSGFRLSIPGPDTQIIGQNFELSCALLKPEEADFKADVLYFDIDACHFPLELRRWKAADRMQPLGMKGSKKISDMLTDRKLAHVLRKQQLVLSGSNGDIMALLPDTCGERYKIGTATASVLALRFKSL